MNHLKHRGVLIAALAFSTSAFAGCGDSGGRGTATDTDSDGDFLTDLQEGIEENLDTDRDGLPDYFDLDSDGDGINDFIEAGDDDRTTAPLDSDDDGRPDFQDLDSDRNGILDVDEAFVTISGERSDTLLDIFGDGIPDYRDLDDDKDNIPDDLEVGPIPDAPLNSDGDTFPGTDVPRPNYQDPDSDNDGILDGHEQVADFDRDGLRNLEDLDSDNDTIPDEEEAGDADLRTIPIDTDLDGAPDFIDVDSDGDGLADAIERRIGTSTTGEDSDGDGVTDLVEVVACFDPEETGCDTFPSDPDRNPRTEGNFVFVMPYRDTPEPPKDTLKFGTDIRVADIYFLMDTTGSMGGAVSSLKASLSTPDTGLIDRLRQVIPDAWFGVSDFRDYTVSPYGSNGTDYAYNHRLDMTESAIEAQDAVDQIDLGFGNDGPESNGPAMYAMATGAGLPGNALITGDALPPRTDCPRGRTGYPCFREEAVPIAVLMSDAGWHNGPGAAFPYDNAVVGGPAPTFEQIINAFIATKVRFVGITVGRQSPGSDDINFWQEAYDHQRAFGQAVGSVDAEGEPFVSLWAPGSPISDAVVDQIELLARGSRFDISITYLDGPEDSVDTERVFLDRVVALPGGDVADCPFRVPVDADGDGDADTFFNVAGGTRVCFDVYVKENTTIEETPDPQLFRGTLIVKGDGFTNLDIRDIYFLVPPNPDLTIPR